jgi:hypothetical protein
MGKPKETYEEARQIRVDNTIMLGLKMIEKSSLRSEENVKVITEIGSGKIVIERVQKGGQ